MRVLSGDITKKKYFIAVDETDKVTRETALVVANFVVYRSRDGGTATVMTTPTIAEVDATNMPGVYTLLLDEDMTIAAGNDEEEMVYHITYTGMLPVTTAIQVVRPKMTAGNTLTVSAGGLSSADAKAIDAAAVASIADGVWDEQLSGHTAGGSTGKRLSNVAGAIVREGTAQGPGTGTNQIQLDTGASAVNGTYDPAIVTITGGTGIGQSRLILSYLGSTKTATVDRDWKVNPDATSDFVIMADAGRDHVNEGLAQAGTINTITLNALASAADDVYIGQIVHIRSGTGADQAGTIIAYNGTTKVATVHRDWATNPDTTSGYVMLPASPVEITDQSVDKIWDEELTGASHNTPNSAGRRLRTLQTGGNYEGGQIWVDAGGTAGVVVDENGTVTNPVDTWADALSLATATGLKAFHVANGTTVTLTAASANYTLSGHEWTLALGGQSVASTMVINADVSGTGTGTDSEYMDCIFAVASLPPMQAYNCSFTATATGGFTMSAAGDYRFINCQSGVAGAGAPLFTAGTGAITAEFRRWSGGITFAGLTADDVITVGGEMGTIDLGSPAGAVNVQIRGTYKAIINVGSAVVNTDGAILAADVAAILVDTGTTIPAAIPTATENADALLNRDMSAVSDTTARSPLNALRFLRNKWAVSGTALTVYKEDDATSAWGAVVDTNAAADPVVGNDPA